MESVKKFLKVGLTGGIASGKSTVAVILRRFGAQIIDADEVGHRVMEPGHPAYGEVLRCFGQGILAPDGSINRRLLGDIVFGNSEARRKLENILHPRMIKKIKRDVRDFRSKGISPIIIEAAVLVETGNHECCDRVVVVYTPVEMQMARLRHRDNLGIDDIIARLDAQLPWTQKLEVADFVIDNSGSQDQTREQVTRVWEQLRAGL